MTTTSLLCKCDTTQFGCVKYKNRIGQTRFILAPDMSKSGFESRVSTPASQP